MCTLLLQMKQKHEETETKCTNNDNVRFVGTVKTGKIANIILQKNMKKKKENKVNTKRK